MFLTLFGLTALVVAFVVLWKEAAAKNRPRKLSKMAGGAAVVFIALLALLTASGKLHWLAALTAGTLPLLRWIAGLVAGPLIGKWLRSAFGGGTQPAGAHGGPQVSTVASADLRMTLRHDSGEMDGEVLTGPLQGQRLSALDLPALELFRAGLAAADSLQLLDAYLDRRFPDWRETSDHASERGAAPSQAPRMDKTQALAVLGLADGASDAQVREAHRRLMQRLHPDRGGTDYLAATLNQAKEVLLTNGG